MEFLIDRMLIIEFFRSSKINTASVVRSSSQTRISHAATSARPSGRISTATPLRTPARTPNRSDRNTFMPSTAEKEKAPVDDKEGIHAKSVKILTELAEVGGFNDLVQKGFKAMTLKQFVAILQHFLQPIVGSTPNDFNTTYVDCVYQWLGQLEYPYGIPKSSLKTPNAPHCLNSIIVLLSWLQDFSAEQESMLYTTSEMVPNDEMTKDIMEKIGEMFTIWNNNQIEFEQAADTVTELYRSNYEGVSHLTTDIGSLRDEIHQLTDKNNGMKKLEQELSGHHQIVQDIGKKVHDSNEELETKKSAEKAARDELKRIQSQLSNQRITMDVRHQLLLEIAQNKTAISSKSNAIMDLREACGEKEILLSNLISKKYQFVDRLNNMTYKLSSDLEITGMSNKFDPSKFVIKLTKDDENLDQMLENLFSGLSSLKEELSKEISSTKENVLSLKADSNQTNTERELVQSKLNQLKAVTEQLTQYEENIEMLHKSYLHNTLLEHQTNTENIEKFNREIEERTKGIEQMFQQLTESKEKKAAFNTKAVAECERLYEERKQEVETHRKYLQDSMAIINEYEKNKKPLSESSQKLLEKVLKKRADKENQTENSKS